MTTDQIAAEAWDKALALYTESGNREEAINEILAAIEKATKQATDHFRQKYNQVSKLLGAAHAREPAPDEARDAYINDYDAGSAEGTP